jgi:hypothetical protein
MNLSIPVNIQPPSLRKPDSSVVTFSPFILETLDITIIDSVGDKVVMAQIRPFSKPLVLWSGEAYESAGDYTQAQVEARVTELLGDNPKAVLETLFAHAK